MFRWFDLFLAMGFGWFIYGILAILFRPNHRKQDTYFALAVLICFTLPIIDNLIKPALGESPLIFLVLSFTRNIYYLIGPMLWLYSRTLLQKKIVRWQMVLIHCIPFIAWTVLNLLRQDLFALYPRPPIESGPLSPPHILHQVPARAFQRVRDMGSFLSPLIYGAAILFQIRKHSGRIHDFYSRTNTLNTLSWLQVLIFSMTGLYTMVLFLTLHPIRITNTSPVIFAAHVRSIPAVLFIFFFSFFSREQRIPADVESDFESNKYKKSALDDDVIHRIYTDLVKLMNNRKTYLNPDLTLDELAGQMDVTKHHLSQVINSKTGGNFYSFVNSYRVREFQEALKTERFPSYTLIAVAFECGFRSSSVFYSLFKKMTGMTPRDYAYSLQKKDSA